MSEEQHERETWKDGRDRRLRALSELAGKREDDADGAPTISASAHNTAASAKHLPSRLDTHRPRVPLTARWRLTLIALALILIVGGVVAAFSHILRNTTTANGQGGLPVRSISVRDLLGLHCISQPVWSPNGKYIAVLGTLQTGDCVPYLLSGAGSTTSTSSGTTPPQTLAIVDASSGHLVRSIPLDPLLNNRPNCNANGFCGPDTARLDSFYGLSWSPDSLSVAMAYADQFSPTLGALPIASLLVVRADGSAHFLITDQTTPLADPHNPNDLRIWNLASRSVQTTNTFDLSPFSLPFAPAYAWNGGNLVAQATTTASGVGNPSGDAAFTPWQSGSVDNASAYTNQSGLLTYQSEFWAWSPGGSRVATFAQVGAQLNVPGLSQPTVNTRQFPGHIPFAPARDAALAQVAHDVAAALERGAPARFDVAWSPDGGTLAALNCSDDLSAHLALLATSDGHTRATATLGFPPSTSSSGCTQDMMPIAWSPDGHTLMTSDAALGTITLWQALRAK